MLKYDLNRRAHALNSTGLKSLFTVPGFRGSRIFEVCMLPPVAAAAGAAWSGAVGAVRIVTSVAVIHSVISSKRC